MLSLDQKQKRVAAFIFLACLFIITRLLLVWGRTFPLGDGGMFYSLIQSVQRDGWTPSFQFNETIFPFIYPPLGFFLTALIQTLSHIPLLTLFLYLPLIYNALFICLAGFLIWHLSNKNLLLTVLLTSIWILLPFSYLWLLYGGGVIRGLGSICFMALVLALVSGFAQKKPILIGILPVLVVLIHPEWAFHSLLVVTLFFGNTWMLAQKKERPFILQQFFIIIIPAIIVSLLLFLRAVSLHEQESIIAAFISSKPYYFIAYLRDFIARRDLMLYLTIGIASGIPVIFRRKEYIWIFIHLFMITFFITRNNGIYICLDAIMLFTLGWKEITPLIKKPLQFFTGIIVLAFALVSFQNAWTLVKSISLSEPFVLPEHATFLSIAKVGWSYNMVAEWTPALSDTTSVILVQGSEWIPGGQYVTSIKNDTKVLQRTIGQGESITALLTQLNPDYLIVSVDVLTGSKPLAQDISDAGYTLIVNTQQGRVVLAKVCPNGSCSARKLTGPFSEDSVNLSFGQSVTDTLFH